MIPSRNPFAVPRRAANTSTGGDTPKRDADRSYTDATNAVVKKTSCQTQVRVNAKSSFRPNGLGICSRFVYIALVVALLLNVSLAVKRISRDLMILPQLSNNPSSTTKKRAGTAAPPVMDVFEVYPAVKVPAGVTGQCQQTLMVYSFGNSYGKPFAGKLTRD
jgi:hypothetical protein